MQPSPCSVSNRSTSIHMVHAHRQAQECMVPCKEGRELRGRSRLVESCLRAMPTCKDWKVQVEHACMHARCMAPPSLVAAELLACEAETPSAALHGHGAHTQDGDDDPAAWKAAWESESPQQEQQTCTTTGLRYSVPTANQTCKTAGSYGPMRTNLRPRPCSLVSPPETALHCG